LEEEVVVFAVVVVAVTTNDSRGWFEETGENVLFDRSDGFFGALDVGRDDARGASLRPAADVKATAFGRGRGGGVFFVVLNAS
jgi:hypothetical protein